MRFSSLVVPLAVASGVSTAFGQTEVIIGEYNHPAARMVAVGLDGSSPHTLFTLDAALWLPLGITVNPATQRMIWIDSAGASEVMQANLDGSDTRVLANISGFARGTSIDAQGRIYYATNNRIERVDANGGNQTVLFVSDLSDPLLNPRVDAVNRHIYFGETGLIRRMNLDGGDRKIIVRGVLTPRCISVDVADGYIYWIDTNTITDFVARARLDGTGFRILYDATPDNVSSSFLSNLILNPATDTLYWCDEVPGTLMRSATDGSGAAVIYTSPSGYAPAGLTFDTGEPAQAIQDCNANGIGDDQDIAMGAADCDNNGWLDACQTNPCPPRTFLLDQGSDAANSTGRAMGKPSQWQVFQPFVVPAEGWDIGEVAIDGFTVNYIADPSGVELRIFPNNAATSLPDETSELAYAAVDLLYSIDLQNWVYAPMSASLTPGTYWLRINAKDPIRYQGTINLGFSGMPSRSRGSSGNFTAPASPIALRLIQAVPTCPADFNQDGGVDGADVEAFFTVWETGESAADFNADGGVDGADVEAFYRSWEAGC